MEVYQYNWVDQVKILLNYDIFFNLTVKEINIKTLEDIIKQEDETNWIFKVFNKVDFGKFTHTHIIILNHEYLLYFFRIIFYSYTICIFSLIFACVISIKHLKLLCNMSTHQPFIKVNHVYYCSLYK